MWFSNSHKSLGGQNKDTGSCWEIMENKNRTVLQTVPVSAVCLCQEGGNIQHPHGLRLEAALYFSAVAPVFVQFS